MISTISSLVLTTTLPTLANTTSTLSGSIHYNVTQPFHIFNNIGETSNNATIANVVDNVVANVNGNVVNGTVLLSSASSSSLDNPFYNLTGNETTTYQQPVFPNYIRVTSMVFCIIIMCLGVIGNVMVPIVILKTKDMRNSTNIFLMNLSVADLMVLLVCTPTVLVEVNTKPETWVLGEEMCKAVPFVEFTVAHASVLTILAISFERYYAICEPLRAGYVCTKARASLICLLAWFFAAICTSPILSISEYRLLPYVDGTTVPACRMPVNNAWPFTYFLVTIVAFFIIPMIILIVLYCVIARTLITDAANIVLNQHLDNYNLRARRQVVLMLGTVVVSFFLCLIPFRVFSIWIILVSEETVSTLGAKKFFIILFFCRVMVYLNSAVNPILYNLMSTKFRDAFLRVCCGRRSRFNFRRGGRLRNGTFSTTITSYRNSTLRQGSVNFRTTRSQSLRTIQNESPDLGRNSSNESMDSKTRLAKDSNNIFNENRSNKNSKISSDIGYTFSALKHIEEVNELSQSSDNNDVQVHFNSDGSGPDYDTYASIKLNGKFEKMQPNGYRKSSGKNGDEFILQESLIRDTDSAKDAESLV